MLPAARCAAAFSRASARALQDTSITACTHTCNQFQSRADQQAHITADAAAADAPLLGHKFPLQTLVSLRIIHLLLPAVAAAA
jgi:hypothetical protein